MQRSVWFCFVIICLVHTSAIRVPGENVDKNTLTSLGIKTLDWQGGDFSNASFHQVHVHHNYSKVSVQNEGISSSSPYFQQKQETQSQSQINNLGQTAISDEDYSELTAQSEGQFSVQGLLNNNLDTTHYLQSQTQFGNQQTHSFGGQKQENLDLDDFSQFSDNEGTNQFQIESSAQLNQGQTAFGGQEEDDVLNFDQFSQNSEDGDNKFVDQQGLTQYQNQNSQKSFGEQEGYDELLTSSSNNRQIYNAHSYGSTPQLDQIIKAESELKNQQQFEDFPDYDQYAEATNIQQQERQVKHFYPLEKPIYVHGFKYPPNPEDVHPLNKQLEVYTKCPKSATGQFVYALSCNQFLNCWNGRGYAQNCAPGTLFNPQTLECDFASKVKCITGPRKPEYGAQTQSSASLKLETGCPAGFSGVVPHHSDCSKFINCANGAEHVMDCPPGTLFSLKINNCDFPYKAECASWSNEFGNIKNIGGHSSQVNNLNYVATDENYQGADNFNKYGQGNYHQSSNNGHDQKYTTSDTFRQHQQYGNGYGQIGNSGSQQGYYQGSSSSANKHIYENHGTESLNQYIQQGYIEKHQQSGTDSSGNYGQFSKVSGTNKNYQQGSSGQNQDLLGSQSQYIHGSHNIYEQTQLQGGYGGHSQNAIGTTSVVTTNKQGAIECPDGATGLFPHPQDCSKFLNCANGQATVQDCGPGTVFNPESKICDFPHNVNCGNSNEQGIYTHGQYQQGSGNQNTGQSSSAVQWQTGKNVGSGLYTSGQVESIVKCPEYASGLYPHPTICSKFLNCANGQTFIQDCGPGTVFNPTSKVCDFPYNVECGATHGEGLIDVKQVPVTPKSVEEASTRPSYIYDGTSGSYSNQQGFYGQNQGNSQSQEGSYVQGQSTGFYGQNQGSYGHGQTANNQGSYGQKHNTQHGEGLIDVKKVPVTPKSVEEASTGPSYIYDGTSGSYSNQQGFYGQNQGNGQSQEGSYIHGQSTGFYGQNQGSYGHGQTANNQGSYGQKHNTQQVYYGQGQTQNGFDAQGQTSWSSDNKHQQGWYGQNQNIGSTLQQSHYGQAATTDSSLNSQTQNQDLYGQSQGQGSYGQTHSTGSGSLVKDQQDDFYIKNVNQNKPGYFGHGQNTDDQELGETRNYNQQFYGSKQDQNINANGNQNTLDQGGTAGASKQHHSPAPFPSTDINADYEFGNENVLPESGDFKPVTLKPKPKDNRKRKDFCEPLDFHCSVDDCIPQTMVCDGIKDCANGGDEQNCEKYLQEFTMTSNSILAVREKERFLNISLVYCAKICLESKGFQCKSFSYRKDDGACYLSDSNVGYSGALIISHPYNYYEVKALTVNCTGLYQCPNKKCLKLKQVCDGVNDCGDRTDEKDCSAQAFGYQIKLGGTDKKHEGRIELKAFGKWGYICDDKFGLRDADVVCKELGFPLGALEIKANSYYAQDVDEKDVFYLMDDVTCLGNETTIRDCDFNGWGVNNCEAQEVVGVVCKTPQETCPKDHWKCDTVQECLPLAFVCDGVFDCTDQSDEGSQHCEAPTELRLAGGSSRYEGRVEIRHNGIWGTVCDDDFNDDAAKVVCKYLGFPGKAAAKKDGYFGPGDGPIWLDQVFCQGNESALQYCVHWNWGEHNCEHAEDVGVICSNTFNNLELVGSERSVQINQRNKINDILPEYLFPERCGLRKDDQFLEEDNVHFRVVKGSSAKKGDYPWQASLRIKNKSKPAHWCGAVVISQKFVLTAAHCLAGFAKGAYFVVAGDYDTDDREGTEQEVYIDEFYVHEQFRIGQKMNNDIALIKLKGEGLTFTKDVQPICLPETDTVYEAGMNCTISGFGSIQSGVSAYSHQLRAGWIPMQSRAVCEMPHVYGSAITDGMICAGSLDEGVDACEGDSGGPLACLHEGYFTLYGLTSWGQHCGHANKPGVYVKVSHYRKWIDDTIRKHS